MNDGDAADEMRMGIGFVRNPVRCPASVSDANSAVERLRIKAFLEIEKFALGPAAIHHAVMDRGDTGRVIAPVFQALQRIDQTPGNRLATDDPNNTTHEIIPNRFEIVTPLLSISSYFSIGQAVTLDFGP
jgi:hypothetical protein